MSTKLFRSTTKVAGTSEPFVDWFDASTESEARELWKTECEACGVPLERATVEFVECDSETLKPV